MSNTQSHKIDIDIRTGTLMLYFDTPDQSPRYRFHIEDADSVINQIKAAREKYMFAISSPLTNVARVEEALFASGKSEKSQNLEFMCDWYTHAMAFMSQVHQAVKDTLYVLSPGDVPTDVYQGAIDGLEKNFNQLDMLIGLHKKP